MAGRLGATVEVVVPGDVDVSGTFTVAVNTRTTGVNETVDVDGVSTTLALPAGPYLRVEGTGIRIEMFGQRISGDVVLEKATSGTTEVVRVGLRNVSAGFGDGTTDYVTLSEGTGFLVLTGPSTVSSPPALTVTVAAARLAASSSPARVAAAVVATVSPEPVEA